MPDIRGTEFKVGQEVVVTLHSELQLGTIIKIAPRRDSLIKYYEERMVEYPEYEETVQRYNNTFHVEIENYGTRKIRDKKSILVLDKIG